MAFWKSPDVLAQRHVFSSPSSGILDVPAPIFPTSGCGLRSKRREKSLCGIYLYTYSPSRPSVTGSEYFQRLYTAITSSNDCLHHWARLVNSGAYERRSHEEACNYHIHPSAIQIQLLARTNFQIRKPLFQSSVIVTT